MRSYPTNKAETMQFQLISSDNLFKLNVMVQEKLNSGWVLYVSPSVAIAIPPTSAKLQKEIYAQAVTKISEADPIPEPAATSDDNPSEEEGNKATFVYESPDDGPDHLKEVKVEKTEPTPEPEGVILASFNGSPSVSMFTVGGNYGDGNATYNGVAYKKGVKLDSKGSITFTPQKNYNMTLIMGTAKSGRDVKLNDVKTTVSGTVNTDGAYYELEPIAITAGTKYVITKGSAEGLVMLIKLEPVSQE